MINQIDYAKRRKTFTNQVPHNTVVIIPSAHEIIRNGDSVYAFRQNSDFYYLTGFNEPDAILVLNPSNAAEGNYFLFNRSRNPEAEIWDGEREGQRGAIEHLKADQSFPIEEFEKLLPNLINEKEVIMFPFGKDLHFDKKIFAAVNALRQKNRKGFKAPTQFQDSSNVLHEMRLIKSEDEIAAMQKAIDITEKGFRKVMHVTKPGLFEYELEAELTYMFKKHGARFEAYNSIVGSGKNSCVLHYAQNNKQIAEGDLVLIDAGAEYDNYAADITRTFPASGTFSSEQRAIYELVLKSQEAAIEAIKPNRSWSMAQDIITQVITQGLLDLGLIKGTFDELLEKKAYLPFYMHMSGHWLGLDVHDVGSYRNGDHWRNLAAGMVFTIEPGIYISSETPNVAKNWHNIGVRIEDDIVVTENGCDVLSKNIPKKIKDIEELMAG